MAIYFVPWRPLPRGCRVLVIGQLLQQVVEWALRDQPEPRDCGGQCARQPSSRPVAPTTLHPAPWSAHLTQRGRFRRSTRLPVAPDGFALRDAAGSLLSGIPKNSFIAFGKAPLGVGVVAAGPWQVLRYGEEVRFVTDSLVEGDGFEPSVPRQVFFWLPRPCRAGDVARRRPPLTPTLSPQTGRGSIPWF